MRPGGGDDLWCIFAHRLLEEVSLVTWHPIPLFRLALPEIVDRVEEMVLVVPAEGGETHAHVEPRRNNARNIFLDEAE